LLASALKERGHSVAVGVLDRLPAADSWPPLESEAVRRNVELFHFPRLWRWDPVPILEIGKFCAFHRIEVVHTWLFLDSFYGRLGAALTERVRAVAGVNGVEYDGASLRACVDRTLARWTSALVPNSLWMADQLVRWGFPARKIRIVPNGVDMQWISTWPQGFTAPQAEGPVVGTMGRLHPVKDLGTFLRACALVARQRPEARFLIAGDGPERESLWADAVQLGIEQNLTLTGDVADVRPILRRLSVFALSSRSESCPNALLEAMALGLPCVATRVGGVPEIIEHGGNGLLSPPGNPEELARRILMLLRDEGLRRRLGAEAVTTVRERFSLEKMTTAYEKLYRDALA
jgi:glycosyltransferase involved in cell wall biosynthesis